MPGELAHTLPKPQYVTLNHLYCTTIVDKLMVQAVSVRYKEKSVTAVFYSVMPQVRVRACVSECVSACLRVRVRGL